MGGALLSADLRIFDSRRRAEISILTGRVVDDAGVLNAATQGQLTDMLAAHERADWPAGRRRHARLTAGIHDRGLRLPVGRHWGIGQKGTNNGALLIVAPKNTRFASRMVTASKARSPTRKAGSSSSNPFCLRSAAATSTPAFSTARKQSSRSWAAIRSRNRSRGRLQIRRRFRGGFSFLWCCLFWSVGNFHF